jgi:YesN/AraC family two-component response regulator
MYQLVIVDDEEKIAEGIANLFPWEQIGFCAVHFNNAAQALNYMQNNQVDVLMSDIEMPGMTGIELCEKIQDSGIKVIFISSHQNY